MRRYKKRISRIMMLAMLFAFLVGNSNMVHAMETTQVGYASKYITVKGNNMHLWSNGKSSVSGKRIILTKSKTRLFIKVRQKSGEYPQTKGYSTDFSINRARMPFHYLIWWFCDTLFHWSYDSLFWGTINESFSKNSFLLKKENYSYVNNFGVGGAYLDIGYRINTFFRLKGIYGPIRKEKS